MYKFSTTDISVVLIREMNQEEKLNMHIGPMTRNWENT